MICPHPKPVRVPKVRKPMRRKARPAHTKAEQAHLDAVQGLGCLVCHRDAEIHHVRSIKGKRIKRNHMLVLPLCPEHHRVEGGFGIGFHAGSARWQEIHGDEEGLLAFVSFRLNHNPFEVEGV